MELVSDFHCLSAEASVLPGPDLGNRERLLAESATKPAATQKMRYLGARSAEFEVVDQDVQEGHKENQNRVFVKRNRTERPV